MTEVFIIYFYTFILSWFTSIYQDPVWGHATVNFFRWAISDEPTFNHRAHFKNCYPINIFKCLAFDCRVNLILTFMVAMITAAILKMLCPKCTSTYHMDHSCEVSLQSETIETFPWRKKIAIGFYCKPPNYLGHAVQNSKPLCTRYTDLSLFQSSKAHARYLDLWLLRTVADNFMC